ncbi:MAG: hypothetical protein R6W85_13075 [Gillisia sp.]
MPKRNLKGLISKIILFYSFFYVIMKIIAILFQDAWALPNLIIALPFAVFAAIGWVMLKREEYSWIYVIAGVVIISVVRYYEMEWVVDLHRYFNPISEFDSPKVTSNLQMVFPLIYFLKFPSSN